MNACRPDCWICQRARRQMWLGHLLWLLGLFGVIWLVLSIGCAGTREVAREADVVEHAREVDRHEQQTDSSSTKTVTAGPVSISESDVLVIPPGSVIDTPTGRVTLPKRGRGARLERHAKSDAGPIVTAEVAKTSIHAKDDKAKDVNVHEHDTEKAKTAVSAGPDWQFWLGVGLVVAVVGSIAWKIFKPRFPWSRS